MNNEESTFILEKGIFGVEIEFSLANEDMEEICQFKELSISCVMFYISYLYAVISEANLDTSYLFFNPSIISGKFKPGSSKATLLSSRLQEAKTGQLVFVLYNYEYHWMLAIIDLSSAVIYYFDLLHNKVNVSLQLIIEIALRIYDIDKGNRRSSAWELVECPKQPSGKKCGFYMMRYMKDVITNLSVLSKGNFGGKKMYTNIEIDEARVQWINCFLTKLQSA